MTTEEQPKDAQWSDDPRAASDPDDLGRGAFVQTVSQRIELATLADPSTVFGLVGQWGSGKSSVLARIREKLSGDWVVGDFTPWATGDSAAMSLEFVSTIAAALGIKVKGDTKRKLARYAGYGAPLLSAIPLVGGGVRGAADVVLNAVASRPPWHKQFESLSKVIQEGGKRVLIVVDDVDRLGADELLTLLRVIRLLGRFRGVHYLVAYDQRTVEDLLASSGSAGRSAAFMEKIIQYPFEVPPISPAASIRLLNEAVMQLVTKTGQQVQEQELERIAELVGVIAPQLQTPRGLGRFAEQLMTFAHHVAAAELDLPDYIAVTWLRLAAHGVWERLPGWHAELRSGERREALTASTPISADEWEARISVASPEAEAAAIVKLLSFMFPGVDSRGLSYNVAHDRALSDQTYFSRYMLLAIPEDDVSDELISEVLGALVGKGSSDRAEELGEILDGSPDRANLAYSRLAALRRNAQTTTPNLLVFLSRRFVARREDTPAIGAPRNTLMTLVAGEVALGLLHGTFSAIDVIRWFGEDESFAVIYQAARLHDFRADKARLTDGFATYWLERLASEPEAILENGGRLRAVADIATVAQGDQARGMLDFAVHDFESYLKIARSFVWFQEWVGAGISYTMAFRGDLFTSALSKEVRDKYVSELPSARPAVEYEVEDRPMPEASADEIDAYVVDMLLILDDSDPGEL